MNCVNQGAWEDIAVSVVERVANFHVPAEINLLLVTAIFQELATKVTKVFSLLLLHHPVKRNEQFPSFAFPFSPAEIERGLILEFRLNHTVELETPLDLVRIVLEFEKRTSHMTNIEQAAKYVRSKNAGSFWLTIDIFAAIEKNYMPSDPSGRICGMDTSTFHIKLVLPIL